MAEIQRYKKNNGDIAYKFQVYTGINPMTGRKSKTKRQGFKTKREASIALKRIESAVAAGSYYKSRDRNTLTFEDVYTEWRNGYQNTVSESTLLKNDGMFSNRILPAFGNQLIDSITVDMLQTQINNWSEYKNSGKWLDEASRVFTYARKIGVLKANPCDLVTKKRKKNQKSKKEFYEKTELKQFIFALNKWSNLQGKALLRLLAFTGIRIGEALALDWDDLDQESKVIRINKAISRRTKSDSTKDRVSKKTELYLKEPKNYPSIRDVSVDDTTIATLLEWKEENQHQLIFTSRKGKWLSPSSPRKWLRVIAAEAGLDPIPIHKLRHTHASLLFEAGASMKEVQSRLGHGDISTTMNVYTHTTQSSRDEFAEKFSKHVDF